MSFSAYMAFYFSVFVDKSDGPICKSYSNDIAGSFGEGHPIMFDGVGVEF